MSDRVQILHVDDDPEFAELAATFLEREREKFVVDTATDGSEGLDRLRANSYDCVVSDYDMPGLSGIEFLEAVRERDPHLPFVLFTGKGSEEVASEAISAGVTDYLQKGGSSEQYALLANRIENAVSARRTAQRAALQEDLMRHAEMVGGTGGWEVDTRTGELHCTTGTRRIFGLEEGEELATLEQAIAFYHPEDRTDIRATIERARASGEQAGGEWRLRAADGDQRLVEATVRPIEEDGEVVALRGTLYDITECRAQREELREERAFVEQALDTLGPFCVVGTDRTLRRWNDSFREATGYSDGELEGPAVTEFVDSADRERLEDALETAMTTGRATTEVELCTADGDRTVHEFRLSQLTDSEGDLVGAVVVGREANEHRGRDGSGQSQLAEMVVRHSPDPMVLVDVTSSTEFHIERVNAAYEELAGREAADIEGQRPETVFDGEFGAFVTAQYRNCIEQQAPVEYAECWRTDGAASEWETRLQPVIRDGAVVALVGTKRDVTTHKRREGDLERHERLLENLPVGVFRTTPSGEFVSMNRALVSLCGADSTAALRTSGVESLYADSSHRALLLDQLEEKGRIENKLVRMESLESEQFWAELSLTLVEEDGNRYIDGIVRDVTDSDRQTPGTEAFDLLEDPAAEPLFLVAVGDRLRIQHVDTTYEDVSGGVSDIHSGELARPDGGDDGPVLDAARAAELRECIRTREPRTFDGVSPLTGNPVDGTARVVPVVVDGNVEYLVGTLDRT